MTENPHKGAARSSKRCRYRITPDRLIIGLLLFQGLLSLSERLDWFPFNHQTWSVLIAFGSVGLAMIFLLLWLAVARFFHWPFQYGTRSLMLLTVAIAMPCSWLAVEMAQERKQGVVRDEIVKLGGGVESEPTWLGRLLMDSSLVSVTKLELFGTQAICAGLAISEELRQLRSIEIGLGEVSDAGLAHLEGLSQLRVLMFNKTQVSDAGLVHLRGLSRLEVLIFYDANVSDAGLAHLHGMSQLLSLWLIDTEVTDAGLVYLRELHQLQMLILNNTKVTDAGLMHLQRLWQLQEMGLTGTKVTNEGLKKIQQALPHCRIRR